MDTDIFIAGGGIAGLAAAARLAETGHHVTLAAPEPPAGPDRRTTAFLQPAVDTLTRAGAWEAMAAGAAPLWTMRLVDAGGRARQVRETADFTARAIQDGPFGYNVANAAAREALLARLADLPVDRIEAPATGLTLRSAGPVVRFADGRHVTARLVVAADGRDSTIRQAAGLAARRWSYGQKALVFPVTHDAPHRGVSTEIHRTGGPLTLVPSPDLDGRPASSVVWMMPGPLAARRAALDDADLGVELTAETMGLFGPLRIAGDRALWPIIGLIAPRLVTERVALVAEAAHVIPPIGAQGLNMSLADIEDLAMRVARAPDPGAAPLLAAYERRRLPEIAARVGGVHILNRFAQAEAQPIRDLRRLGLAAIHRIAPIRTLAMQIGMGARPR